VTGGHGNRGHGEVVGGTSASWPGSESRLAAPIARTPGRNHRPSAAVSPPASRPPVLPPPQAAIVRLSMSLG
jgi:hypothetical protein